MSKKELKIYLKELTKEQLEEQLLELYSKFKPVKTYYNFVFNPKEDKLLEEAKFKISKEYFPINGRKAKARRSVAQKYIRHFIKLGVDSSIIADVMLYNIEVAQQFSLERTIKQEAFYKSMLNSFRETTEFVKERGIQNEFELRILKIVDNAKTQDWINWWGFEDCLTHKKNL